MVSPAYDKLIGLLSELLQLDKPELNFGIYRVINERRAELEQFLQGDLLPKVREALQKFDAAAREAAERELSKVESDLAALGVEDKRMSPKWQELSAEVALLVASDRAEEDVYSLLFEFFRRYYKDGDFLALRRYRAGTYAMPYEGEEVLLYWANRDQYYIKTVEDFQAYAFKVDGASVRLQLHQAQTETDNKKAAKGATPRFILSSKKKPKITDGELILYFEYRPVEKAAPQVRYNAEAVEKILEQVPGIWKARLAKSSGVQERSVIDLNLHRFTAKNTFDYFVHKDLQAFLLRELDFFLKSDVLRLDDLLSSDAVVAEATRRQAVAIRQIAIPLIAFMAQLENFQRDLYLKKKLVVQTDYCLTVGDVPDSLWAELLEADALLAGWEDLFKVSNVDLEVLRARPELVVDTAQLPEATKARLLELIPDLDSKCDGILVQGDNRQALSLAEETIAGQARLVYIDPPFNTEGDSFLYKDSYRTSSWLAMMQDRLELGRRALTADGTFYLHLDANANYMGRQLMDDCFGGENYLNEVIWRIGWVSGYKTAADRFVRNHDTLLVYQNGPKPYFNKDAARIPYKDVAADAVEGPLAELRTALGIAKEDVRSTKVVFKDKRGNVFKVAASDKEGRYNVEDTWNSSEYEDLHSNKIKRNVAEYTPNGSDLTQKPEELLKRIIEVSSEPGDLVVDFFAGSGTTPAVAAKLGRRYFAVEMGHHFDSDLLWRMKQVLFGKQVGISASVDHQPGGVFKYLRLESYEDALEGIELERTEAQLDLLDSEGDARDQYLVRYLLNEEASGGTLLSSDAFLRPFAVETTAMRSGSATRVRVDLAETYNLMTGRRVVKRHAAPDWQIFECEVGQSKNLVVWRNVEAVDETRLRQVLVDLDLLPRLTEFDLIQINGDTALEQLRGADETWTVSLLDADFSRAMFSVRP